MSPSDGVGEGRVGVGLGKDTVLSCLLGTTGVSHILVQYASTTPHRSTGGGLKRDGELPQVTVTAGEYE